MDEEGADDPSDAEELPAAEPDPTRRRGDDPEAPVDDAGILFDSSEEYTTVSETPAVASAATAAVPSLSCSAAMGTPPRRPPVGAVGRSPRCVFRLGRAWPGCADNPAGRA